MFFFLFLEVNFFSIYLNRRVFVMLLECSKWILIIISPFLGRGIWWLWFSLVSGFCTVCHGLFVMLSLLGYVLS